MTEKIRHHDGRSFYHQLIHPTIEDPTLVICPGCSDMAKVLPAPDQSGASAALQLICSHCGLSKRKNSDSAPALRAARCPVDPFFARPLCLQISCRGELLWVHNRRHLDLLESYVAAELRERSQRDGGWRNATIISRLPAWIKSAKNRESLLKALARLRIKGGYDS
jgi:hypothetical protein